MGRVHGISRSTKSSLGRFDVEGKTRSVCGSGGGGGGGTVVYSTWKIVKLRNARRMLEFEGQKDSCLPGGVGLTARALPSSQPRPALVSTPLRRTLLCTLYSTCLVCTVRERTFRYFRLMSGTGAPAAAKHMQRHNWWLPVPHTERKLLQVDDKVSGSTIINQSITTIIMRRVSGRDARCETSLLLIYLI